MKRTARRIDRLPAVPGVLAGHALVAAPVISRETGHELLRIFAGGVCSLCKEVNGVPAPQRCGEAPMVQYLDIAVLPAPEAEAEVDRLRRQFGAHGGQATKVLLRAEPQVQRCGCSAEGRGDG